jgi:sn-glycerol 3-phosphate transport system ATP-binding protein
MRVELQALHKRLGTTSLYVTHDQVEAMTLAHRMIVMNAGRAEQIGAPLDVYAKPATTFVASFIGSPPMNLMPTKLNGRDLLLGVRPEHLEPCTAAQANFTANIDLVEPLGADTLAYGIVEGTRIIARLPAAMAIAEGPLPLCYAPLNRHYFDPQSGARVEIK